MKIERTGGPMKVTPDDARPNTYVEFNDATVDFIVNGLAVRRTNLAKPHGDYTVDELSELLAELDGCRNARATYTKNNDKHRRRSGQR